MSTAAAQSMTFADSLRKARSERGITQRALARSLRISPSVVSLWESGRRLPDVEMAISIARVLGVTVQELLAMGPVVPADRFICQPCNAPMREVGNGTFECPICKFNYDAGTLRAALDSELVRASEALGTGSNPRVLAAFVEKVYWTGHVQGVEYSAELEKQMSLALEQEKLLQNLGFRNPTRTARLLAQIAVALEKSPGSLQVFEKVLPALKTMLTTVPQSR